MGHGSWVKWVTKIGWVTWVLGHYVLTHDPSVFDTLKSFLCCQTLLDVFILYPSFHRQNVKGTSVPSMRVTLYLHSATTCIQKLLR